MGEVTAPGCFAGSSGAGSVRGRDAFAAAGRGGGAGASGSGWPAPRPRWPAPSSSISLSPVSSSRRASSRTISGSTASFSLSLLLRSPVMSLALAARADQRGQAFDGERVAGNAEAAQAGLRHGGDVGMMAKTLARKNVADMDFDHRHRDGRDRVADCNRGVRVGTRVDDDTGGFLGGSLLDRVHDFALVVRLPKLDLQLVPPGGFAAKLFHVPQCRAAIGFRLARAE